MQRTRFADLLQLFPQAPHALADHSPVGLDLRLARAAQEAKAASLAFKVGPTAHQSALLIIEMRQFDLQPPLRSRGTLAKYLEDQPRPVDDLAL